MEPLPTVIQKMLDHASCSSSSSSSSPPSPVIIHGYESLDRLSRTINKLASNTKNQNKKYRGSKFLLVKNFPSQRIHDNSGAEFDAFLAINSSHLTSGNTMHFTQHHGGLLVLKLRPSDKQSHNNNNIIHLLISNSLQKHLLTYLDNTHLEYHYWPMHRRPAYLTHHPSIRIPDGFFVPISAAPPTGSKKSKEWYWCWPTLVMETGTLENPFEEQYLYCGVDWWFRSSKGSVRIVLLVLVDQATRTLRFEKWVPVPGIEDDGQFVARGVLAQRVVVTGRKKGAGTGAEVIVTGAPLRLEFEALFGRLPEQRHQQGPNMGMEMEMGKDLLVEESWFRGMARYFTLN